MNNNFYLTINLCGGFPTASATDIIGDYINAFRIITNDVDAITHVMAIFPDNKCGLIHKSVLANYIRYYKNGSITANEAVRAIRKASNVFSLHPLTVGDVMHTICEESEVNE